MVLRMSRPMKRPSSSFHQFRMRIPADVLLRARGLALLLPIGDTQVPLLISPTAVTVQLSLRTRDPREAKARQGTVTAHLERVWRGLREGPRRLTHRETIALAGEVYGAMVGAFSRMIRVRPRAGSGLSPPTPRQGLASLAVLR